MADDFTDAKLAEIFEHNQRIEALSPVERGQHESLQRTRRVLEAKEQRAALLKSEAAIRAKLRRQMEREPDPNKKLAIEFEIELHKIERIYTRSHPNKNRLRGYKNQASMLAR